MSGVRFRSILDELKTFKTLRNWLLDLLHELLEGQGQFLGKIVLSKWILSPAYTISEFLLKSRNDCFNYGTAEQKNKPSRSLIEDSLKAVSTDHKLQQRGSQMWTLLRVLPFLVADRVPEEDRYLQILLLQNQIMKIVFAPKISISGLPYLDALIDHYHEFIRELFSE